MRTVKILDEDTIEVTTVYIIKKTDVLKNKEKLEARITKGDMYKKEKKQLASIEEQLKEFEEVNASQSK